MESPPVNTPSRNRYQRVLNEYLRVRHKQDRKALITRKAQSASFDFYESTKKAIPSVTKIKRDVHKQGWRLLRPGIQQKDWARRAGDPPGKVGWRKALNRLKAGVIERRLKGRGFVATGWLPAVRKFGGSTERGQKIVQVRNPRGRVVIDETSPTRFTIVVVNATPGILYVERKFHIIQHGLNIGTRDMISYLRQKRSGGSGKVVGGSQRN